MIREPDTEYARTPDGAHLAFQVVGDGPQDLVIGAHTLPLDSCWDDSDLADALDRLARSVRLVLFDPRGSGSSDALPQDQPQTPEEGMHDIAAVMDAAGSERAFQLRTDNIASAVLFATTWPERTAGLITVNAYARLARAPDFPIGLPDTLLSQFEGSLVGEDALADARQRAFELMCRPRLDDERFRRWFVKAYQRAAPPRTAVTLLRRDFETDARHLLGLVQVPTLVLHTAQNPYIRPAHGRYIADHVPGARFVELPGDAHHLGALDVDLLFDEVAQFVAGAPMRPRIDRAFATVLFSDIVGSTSAAVRLGDAGWRALLDRHDALVDRQLARFGGRLVKRTGDGVVATFDGPARAVSCAIALRDGMGRLDLDARVGIHAGEVEGRGEDVSGISVHVASRVQAAAAPGQILVTRTVVDLVAGSGLRFEDLGELELRGVPDQWRLFAVQA